MTRGHRGSLALQCAASSSATPCRFIPAHHSDGVTEATAPSDEEFGEERLRRSLSLSHGQLAHDVIERLLDDVRRFSERADFADDLTLVAVSFRG